jgi:site-specific DNA-adenine methylase
VEVHQDRRLVEPFCGGLAVALSFVEKIQKHLVGTEAVKVLSLEAFVALANEGQTLTKKCIYITRSSAGFNLRRRIFDCGPR